MKKAFLTFIAVLLALCLCACGIIFDSGTDADGEAPQSESSAGVSSAPAQGSSSPASSEKTEAQPGNSGSKKASVSSSGESSSSSAAETPSSEPADSASNQPDWSGVYLFGGSSDGEIFIVEGVEDGAVSGTYIFTTAAGSFGSRDFSWTLEENDPAVAAELFQNGVSYIYYHLQEDRITVDYPDGWWADRDYLYICGTDEKDRYPDHVFLSGNTAASSETSSAAGTGTSSPFYGVWIAAFEDASEAEEAARALQEKGFDAGVYKTTDWSNLNVNLWYVVSAGEYRTEDEAETALSQVQAAGYGDAYVKYTGERQG